MLLCDVHRRRRKVAWLFFLFTNPNPNETRFRLFVRSFVCSLSSLTHSRKHTCKGTPPQTRSKPFKSFAHFVIHGKEKKTQKKKRKEKKHETRAHTHTHKKAQKQKKQKTTKEQHLRQFMEPPTSTKMNENQSKAYIPWSSSLPGTLLYPPV